MVLNTTVQHGNLLDFDISCTRIYELNYLCVTLIATNLMVWMESEGEKSNNREQINFLKKEKEKGKKEMQKFVLPVSGSSVLKILIKALDSRFITQTEMMR